MVRKPMGWRDEPARHGLAARGIKTTTYKYLTDLTPGHIRSKSMKLPEKVENLPSGWVKGWTASDVDVLHPYAIAVELRGSGSVDKDDLIEAVDNWRIGRDGTDEVKVLQVRKIYSQKDKDFKHTSFRPKGLKFKWYNYMWNPYAVFVAFEKR